MSAEDMAKSVDQDNAADEAPEFIDVDFTDGGSERCEILGVFDCQGGEYIALAPESDDEGVYFYEYEENEDGSFSMGDIEDDGTWEAVAKTFEELVSNIE